MHECTIPRFCVIRSLNVGASHEQRHLGALSRSSGATACFQFVYFWVRFIILLAECSSTTIVTISTVKLGCVVLACLHIAHSHNVVHTIAVAHKSSSSFHVCLVVSL